MLRACVRLVLLGLVAAVAMTTADRVNYTDLSHHYIEYDIITLSVQTEIETVEPIAKATGNDDIEPLFAAWVDKFHTLANSGKMSVQENADDRDNFYNSAGLYSSSFVASAKAAVAKSPVDFFKFHSFMPAATWDVIEYGIVRMKLSGSYNYSRLDPIKAYMTTYVNSEPIARLQEELDAFLADQETKYPGFKNSVSDELDKAYKTVWVNNPTRAPTAAPSTTPKAPTPTSSTSATSTLSTTAPASTAPVVYTGAPIPKEETVSAAPTTPAPTATKKSSATVTATSAVASAIVLVVASALL